MEYQQIAAGGFFSALSTDVLPFAGGVFWNGAGRGSRFSVFGTLLGPEATGPWSAGPPLSGGGAGCGFWCFRFPGCICLCVVVVPLRGWLVRGVWYGVVV